jgi:hypothetical protein
MEERDPELEKKAHRAQMILYGFMAFFALIPFVLIWLHKKGYFN